jgi:hypothetical protein
LLVFYTLIYTCIYSGWLFHRSNDAGFIYSPRYAVFLAMVALPFLVPPALLWLAKHGRLRTVAFALVPAALVALAVYVIGAEVITRGKSASSIRSFKSPRPACPLSGHRRQTARFESLRLPARPPEATASSPTPRDTQAYSSDSCARSTPQSIEVFNAGRAWYTTRHTLINYTTYYQDWKPDLVIEMHAINDLVRSFSAPGVAIGPFNELYTHFYGPPIDGARPPTFERVVSRRLLRLTDKPRRAWFSELIPRSVEKDYPLERYASIAAFEVNIRKMINAARSNGAEMMLMTQPSLYHARMNRRELEALRFPTDFCSTPLNWMQLEVPSALSMERAMAAFNDRTRHVAASEHIALIEAEAAVEKTCPTSSMMCTTRDAERRRSPRPRPMPSFSQRSSAACPV